MGSNPIPSATKVCNRNMFGNQLRKTLGVRGQRPRRWLLCVDDILIYALPAYQAAALLFLSCRQGLCTSFLPTGFKVLTVSDPAHHVNHDIWYNPTSNRNIPV